MLAERSDPDSLLNWTIDMIRLRKECPEIGLGDWKLLRARRAPGILVIRYDWGGSTVLALHNFENVPREARIELPDADAPLQDLRSGERLRAARSGRFEIPLEAYGYRWIRSAS